MKSRLLTNLDTAIAAATQAVQADCLRAERAGLLARQGQIAEARAVLSALQAQYARQPDVSVSAWLSLAEGYVSYFSDLNRNARDKISRAYALSAPARDTRLRALSLAWLAHMDYVDHDLEPMARHIAECFELAEPEHHAAQARGCLVTAMSYHFGGRFEAAQPWYAKARQHANAEGDEAMLGAVMHNMAGLLADESRQTVLRGVEDDAATRRAMLGLESIRNFNLLVGTESLNALVPLLRAHVSSLQGRCADAVALYEAHFSDGLLQGLDRKRAFLGADLAWCRLQLGQTEQSLKDALAAEVALPHDHDVDDRAAAHSRLAQVFSQLGQAEASARHKAQADIDWRTHERDQALTVALLDKALSKLRA